MDELLYARVKQLKAIDDRLQRSETLPDDKLRSLIIDVRWDLKKMIADAEQEHTDF